MMNKEELKWYSGKMTKKEEQEYFINIYEESLKRIEKEITEERKINELFSTPFSTIRTQK